MMAAAPAAAQMSSLPVEYVPERGEGMMSSCSGFRGAMSSRRTAALRQLAAPVVVLAALLWCAPALAGDEPPAAAAYDPPTVAIADLDKKRLKEAAAKYGVPKVYSSGEEMLRQEQLDVVSVATPNKYHKPMKDVPRKGQIVLQDHPGEIHFRNIRIKPFD